MSKFDKIKPLVETDAYKIGRWDQFPEDTSFILNNWTNRGSRIARIDRVVHFGLQAFLKYWAIDAWKPFFEADEDEVATLYEDFTEMVIGTRTGAKQIRELHQLGYLPLVFKAVPEGTLVPIRVPSFTVENTDPRFAWLVGYLETALSASYWQPSYNATQAYYFRQMLDKWAIKTTGTTEGVQWQNHDFSFRGMAGIEAAAASGAAHLLSSTGSDNLNAALYVEDYYAGDNGLVLASVPATEHATMCAGGDGVGEERATYLRMLNLYPTGIVSIVSDTWDLWKILRETLPSLQTEIMARDGKLVIRPDSGDPVDILTGTENFIERGDYAEFEWHPDAPAAKIGVIELLWQVFGGTVNEQGYKVLDSHIGTIYGDAIFYERAEEIFNRLEAKGFASSNVVFGVGSYTYQYNTRDSVGSAIKATWVRVNSKGKEMFKDPVTDNGLKKSARGRLAVIKDKGTLKLLEGSIGAAFESSQSNLLRPVWKDGAFIRYQSFADVRAVLATQ